MMRSWTLLRLILIFFFLGGCSRNPLGDVLEQPILNFSFSLSQSCTNTLNQDAPYSCQIITSEVLTNLVYVLDSIQTTCAWAVIDPVTGIISGIPNDNQVGVCQVVVNSQNTMRRAIAYAYLIQVDNLPAN